MIFAGKKNLFTDKIYLKKVYMDQQLSTGCVCGRVILGHPTKPESIHSKAQQL